MQTNQLIEYLRRSVPHDGDGRTDGQLLDSFVRDKADAALAALVHRHAAMVWGVCRRLLRGHHDAEDAFQATFLVLVRKAASLPDKELVGHFLYGVAHQTAVRMRAIAARRGARERQVAVMPEPTSAEEYLWNDLGPVLDDELSRLPDKYRILLVMCHLEGRTRKDVARRLGLPEGTVASRLVTARAMLAKRLARRGVVVSGVLLGAVLTSHASAVLVPATVVSTTISTATLMAAGQASAAISPTVAALLTGVTTAMSMSKVKVVLTVGLVAGLALGGVGVSAGLFGDSPAMARHHPTTEPTRSGGADSGKDREPAPDPLEVNVSLSADNLPLKDALTKLAAAAGLEVVFDTEALEKTGLDLEKPITAKIDNVPLAKALGRLIDWNANPEVLREVRKGKLVITTLEAWQARVAERLPEWMKPLYGRGLLATLDDNDDVVTVTAGEVVTDDVLAKLKTLPRLRELHVETTKEVTAAGLAHLAKMPRLEKLSLYSVNVAGPGLGDDAIRGLVGSESLRELSLTECGTTDVGVKLLEKLPQLTSLSLRQEGLLTDEALKSVGKLRRLKSLSLDSYVATERLGRMRFTADGVRRLKDLKDLESLHLVGQEVPADALAFPKLTSLGLGHPSVDDAVAAKVGELRELRDVELSYCGLGDAGLKSVAALPELRRLSVASTGMTDTGIGHLRGHKRLEHVTVRVTGLTDKALEHLATIKTVTRLDLYGGGEPGAAPGQNFSIAGLQQFKTLPELETLWLVNIDMPGGGYAGLAELKQLRELTFLMSNVTPEELESLETALPNLRISASTGGSSWMPRKRPGPR